MPCATVQAQGCAARTGRGQLCRQAGELRRGQAGTKLHWVTEDECLEKIVSCLQLSLGLLLEVGFTTVFG